MASTRLLEIFMRRKVEKLRSLTDTGLHLIDPVVHRRAKSLHNVINLLKTRIDQVNQINSTTQHQ